MNKPLNAFMTTLTWQRQQLQMAIQDLAQQQLVLDKQRQHLQQQLSAPTRSNIVILPELEMTRHAYHLTLLQQQTKLNAEQQALSGKVSELKAQEIKLATQFKCMEKYQQRQLQQHHFQQQQQAQHQADEWILQQRNFA